MQSLVTQINELNDLLSKELQTCKESGVQFAENEREYRVALRAEMLQERAKGTPVTIMSDICRGNPDIALLKCRRDSAEAIYKASQEAINVYKLRIRMIDAQIAREWHSN